MRLDIGYNSSYTLNMKTAISLPDPLFQAAEQFAEEKGLSRSELYARAIQFYLKTYRYQGVTATLDQLYAEELSTLESGFSVAQAQILPKEDW